MRSAISPLRLLAGFLAISVAGCGAWKSKAAPEKPKIEGPRLVGRIASIPPDRSYVLIQSYGPWTAAIGTILTTRGENERSANLRFSGETLGQFAAADVQSGEVERGDAVYSQHTPKPSTESFPGLEGETAAPAAETEPPAPVPDSPVEDPVPPIEPSLPESVLQEFRGAERCHVDERMAYILSARGDGTSALLSTYRPACLPQESLSATVRLNTGLLPG